MNITCFYCTIQFPNSSTNSLMNHLRSLHGLGFRGIKALVNCGDCTFSTVNTKQFSRHVTQNHGAKGPKASIYSVSDGNDVVSGANRDDVTSFETICSQDDVTREGRPANPPRVNERIPEEQWDSGACDYEKPAENLDTFISRFILELYSKGSTTRSQVQCVVDGAAGLIESIMDGMRKKCEHILKDDSDLKQKIAGVFNSYSSPFARYRTEYLRTKSLAEKGLVEPHDVTIGTRLDSSGQQGICTVNSTIQYVPLQKTLELLYSKEEFCQAIRTPCQYKPGIAALHQTNSLYMDKPDALKLAIYNDDIEVGNPLGSKSGVNKLTMYYFMIMNTPNKSSLSSIHLALIAYASDVKEYGHAKVLRPLIEDLKRLETGMQLEGGLNRKVFGTVVSLPGDNLAANETQGFVGSFSANYYCRLCKMHQSVAQTATKENVSLFRTKEQHSKDLKEVQDNPLSVSQHGVKTTCVFDELAYFSAIESYSPDCMHDIFEGVAKKELSLIIKEITIIQKYLTLSTLNNIIRSYDYGFIDSKNKPSPVLMDKGDIKIRQTASQTWCLLRLLPFMVGHHVPEGNAKWEIILYLKEIVEHLFSPYDTVASTYTLADLVDTHHTEYLKAFPEQKLTPKHHFLIHYGEAIRRSGPVSDYWCMRFEAKHKMAKLVASASCNFINMPKTLATRYQLASFHHWSQEAHLINQPTVYNRKADVISSIDCSGQSYFPGMVICCGINNDGTPDILMISKLDNGPIAHCWKATTHFNNHSRAYEIIEVDKDHLIAIRLNLLTNRSPMDVLYQGSQRMVSKKANLV